MKYLIVLIIGLFLSCEQTQNSQGEDFIANVDQVAEELVDDSDQLTFFEKPTNPLTTQFQQFPMGSILPKGWILAMMESDLEKGIVGALKDLYPGIQSDDLYFTARRGGMDDIPEMGDLVLTGAAWEKSIMWWNAETIGNWWDGYIRHAFLTRNKEAMQASKSIVDNLVASQDEDGYIGIYKPNLRYQHEGSNGELWAQTTAFRTMLAYYEFTQDKAVLNAVEKAMALTMANYGAASSNPFELKNAFGGVTHGLMLTDVCETLFRITQNQAYQEYATYLYKAFSTFSVNRAFNDIRYPFLKNKEAKFEGHAAHTYEHIRSMVNAYYNTGYPELETAYQNMLAKLEPCILPSGAGHGNEWIAKLDADVNHTAVEYCSMLELRNSYGSLLQKTGEIHFADQAEKLTYNAMLGARNKQGTAITYGKPDNCTVLDGKHHENGEEREDPRYKYSPTHSEPAVCCVPNYGRNLSYFLDQMWMKTNEGIAITMFGPSLLNTTIEDTEVTIEQITNYPFSDEVSLKITIAEPKAFELLIRKPSWSTGIEDETQFDGFQDGYYRLNREWQNGDLLTVEFKNEIQVKTLNNGESYLQRGPLVYAYEIPHREETIKEYEMEGYTDYYCFPKNEDYVNLQLMKNVQLVDNIEQPISSIYDTEFFIQADFYHQQKERTQKLKLIPMGQTVLRKLSFPRY